ncbi:TPA: hypothetical protein ACHFZJ_002572 [Escherichia coli]
MLEAWKKYRVLLSSDVVLIG